MTQTAELLLCRAVAAGDLARALECLPAVTDIGEVCLAGVPLLSVAADLGYADVLRGLLSRPGFEPDCLPALCLASQRGHADAVTAILDQCPGDERLPATALIGAAEGNAVDLAHALLSRPGADVDRLDERGRSALYVAACRGNEAVVDCLISRGASVNLIVPGCDQESTALHGAALNGHEGVTATLLRAGASTEEFSYLGTTPLHDAAEMGHLAVASALLRHGAAVDKVSLRLEYPTRELRTPLMLAIRGGFEALVALLLSAGAAVDPPIQKETPLLTACVEENPALVRLLVEAGADVNRDIGDADTPLMITCLYSHANKHAAEQAATLLAAGADVNVTDALGVSPLMKACSGGRVELVAALLAAGANIDHAIPSTNVTALYSAAANGRVAVTRLLVESGADLEVAHGGKWTPLAKALSDGSYDVVSVLQKAGARLEAANFLNPSALEGYQTWRALRLQERYALLLVCRGVLSVHMTREVASFL